MASSRLANNSSRLANKRLSPRWQAQRCGLFVPQDYGAATSAGRTADGWTCDRVDAGVSSSSEATDGNRYRSCPDHCAHLL
jgi:hypothetical protein